MSSDKKPEKKPAINAGKAKPSLMTAVSSSSSTSTSKPTSQPSLTTLGSIASASKAIPSSSNSRPGNLSSAPRPVVPAAKPKPPSSSYVPRATGPSLLSKTLQDLSTKQSVNTSMPDPIAGPSRASPVAPSGPKLNKKGHTVRFRDQVPDKHNNMNLVDERILYKEEKDYWIPDWEMDPVSHMPLIYRKVGSNRLRTASMQPRATARERWMWTRGKQ